MNAAASVAVGDLLRAGPAPARVLAVFPAAVYLQVTGASRVVTAVTRDGVALPNAVVIDMSRRGAPFALVAVGQAAAVGGGAIDLASMGVRAVRWWDPVPRLARTDPLVLAERLAAVEQALPPWPPGDGPMGTALRERAAALRAALPSAARPAARAAAALVGLGPGLTPAGDDVVAGLLAGLRLLPTAVPAPGIESLAAVLATTVLAAAAHTTAPSAALLDHAARGEVALPAGEVLAALTGTTSVAPAVERLLAVGHTSGHDLATGLVMAARTVLAWPRIGQACPQTDTHRGCSP